MLHLRTLILSLPLMLSACAAPPEVKQLSLKQQEYLEVLSHAVAAQSDALISVAEKMKKQAEAKIAEHEERSLEGLKNLVVKTIPGQGRSKRVKTADAILKQAAQINKKAEKSRQKLEDKLAKIKRKTAELQLYLEKIKEVQLTLDAYIQSKKAGEKVLSSISGHSAVSGLFSQIDQYLPKIKQTSKDLQDVLKTLENK